MFLKFFIDRLSEPWHNLIMVSDTQTLESKMTNEIKKMILDAIEKSNNGEYSNITQLGDKVAVLRKNEKTHDAVATAVKIEGDKLTLGKIRWDLDVEDDEDADDYDGDYTADNFLGFTADKEFDLSSEDDRGYLLGVFVYDYA